MVKKKETLVNDILLELKDEILRSDISTSSIPNIITFCEDKDWLGLSNHPTNPISLYPMQKIVLKTFYRGSIGNEDLELTDREIEICQGYNLTDSDKGNVLGKYDSGELFNELVLVWGRRASKDFIVSLIALYEAMKLLECPGGDPYAVYELSSATTINILTVANSKFQARLAFDEIREKLIYSNYFKDKYTKEGIGAQSIFLLTPQDKKDNIEFKAKGVTPKKGSIGIIVGHSNSDSLLGMGCIVLILDEVASYKSTGGASSGDRIYAALTPTVATYCRKIYKRNSKGEIEVDSNDQKIVIKRIYDGKIISISSPRAQEGKFYELYSTADDISRRLACRLPTWEVNPTHTRDSLRESVPTMSEAEFNMEFGAEFSGVGAESFFTEEQVNSVFKGHNLKNELIGKPGRVYFCHLDPATSSHNYALVILHKEYYLNPQTQKSEFIIIVDHIKYWTPVKSPINPHEVLDYVVGLKRKFRLVMLTYDQWASRESILRLRKASIPNKETRFTSIYKTNIYRELENLINQGRIKIPYDNLLRNEMIELQRKFTPTGFKVFPKKEGDGVKSDDVCVIPDTIVYTNKGASFIKDVKIGDNILTHDGSYQKIIGFSSHKTDHSFIKIQPYYGLSIVVTDNHMVEVLDKNNKKMWKRCDELTMNDMLIKSFNYDKKKFVIDLKKYVIENVNKHCNISDYITDKLIRCKNANGKWHKRRIASSSKFGYICGLFLSEGSLGHHGISFGFNIKENKIYDELRKCIKDEFGISATNIVKHKDDDGCQMQVNSQIVKSLFKDIFEGRKAINKRIPLKLMSAPLKFQKELIRGFFDGDGCLDAKRIRLTTTSRLLANQLQQILLRLKIVSGVSISKRNGKFTFIGDRKIRYNSDLYNVSITDASSFNKLGKILKLNMIKKQSKYHKPKYCWGEGCLLAKVYKIENYIDNNKSVINIAVANNNSYVSESVNSHNCDALSGACYTAIQEAVLKLPLARTVHTGITPQSNNMVWRNMQGGAYYGSGQQVTSQLEQRASWPRYRR